MTHTAFDLVFFDLDGTLLESAAEIAGALNDTLVEVGLPPLTRHTVETWIGHGTRALLRRAFAGQPEDRFPVIQSSFAGHYLERCGTDSRPYPFVMEALAALKHRGIRRVVLTNKESRYTHRLLQAHGLEGEFDAVIAGDTLPVQKPDPEGIRLCLERFRVRADRALMVGDSAIDVQTARNAGVVVWVVPYGYNMGLPIEASQPDRIIPDFSVWLPPAETVQISSTRFGG